ncbi:hypothetical protein NYQ25_15895 [Curtobacterium flaccumfaciens pv. flaccumfaciens]|uniref:hypothetical protein n=1 Tax=Curtobacterium flaccumfaciens TaxID=2035 RepID=UPI00217D0C16|nr:hypothetical protein [Curtobacterium flaccumfaciens]MCS6586456.1 hypothetical protein [Curtobacterium flaccumfaciens pv. flaccumfaciens]
MKVSLPASIALGLASLFSLYHLVLAAATLPRVDQVAPIVACMVLYAAATGLALFVPGGSCRSGRPASPSRQPS